MEIAHGIIVVGDYKEVVHTPLYVDKGSTTVIDIVVMVEGRTHGGRAMLDLLGYIFPMKIFCWFSRLRVCRIKHGVYVLMIALQCESVVYNNIYCNLIYICCVLQLTCGIRAWWVFPLSSERYNEDLMLVFPVKGFQDKTQCLCSYDFFTV